MAPRCSVFGCSCRGPNGIITKRYYFPKDKALRAKWLYLCGINYKVSDKHRVCERHFSQEQRLIHQDEVSYRGRRVLKPEAVPDANLPDISLTPNGGTMPSYTKCVPLSVKLKILDDQEKGYGPKIIMKKYRVKKSAYYRILSEKEMIRDYVDKGGSLELSEKPEKEEEAEDEVDGLENVDDKDKVSETRSEGDVKVNGDEREPLNKAVTDWYNEQKAEGKSVDEEDINGAAERLARELGYTHFKLNSGWPLRFRKPQSTVDNSLSYSENSDDEDKESTYSESSAGAGVRGMRALRIQDQITAFQRLEAGESAAQIALDMGVSRQTIQRVKKKLKDTLFTPTTDQKYHISVESMKSKFKDRDDCAVGQDTERNKESVLASIERRKQLKFNKGVLTKKDQGLSYNEKIEAVRQCKAGVPLKTIAHNFGVSPSTIQRVKKKFSQSHQLPFKQYMRLDQKVRVLERLDEGETIIEIAQDLGVHDTTIRAIKKGRLKIMSLYRMAARKPGAAAMPAKAPISKYENMERKLLEWINDLKCWKIPLSSAMIQKKALMIQMNIAQEEGSSSTQSFLPTKEWLTDFKRRNKIDKFSQDDTETESELDELRFTKAAPKSKKKFYAARRGGGDKASSSKPTTPPPPPTAESMPLSRFAEGLREMYLSRSLPANPYRCNAFTPRVLLSTEEPRLTEKHTADIVKTEPPSDEETWLTAHTNVGSDSDWTEQNWDANSLTEISSRSVESPRRKRKNTSNDFNRKRRRIEEEESDDDGSIGGYSRSSYLNVPIKQEPQSSVDSMPPNVPMAVLPAGSTYVPPLPMFQMPTAGLTMFMPPESQQMMMQHSLGYPHNNASDLFMNQQQEQQQQQLRERSVDSNSPTQFDDIHGEANAEPSIQPENENVIVMPFGRENEQEKSPQVPPSEPDSVSDALAEKARKERAAAIAENMGIDLEGPSQKKLRDLTFKLLELNNKNMICDERLAKAKEEYEKTVTTIEAEKKINDKEIDKVLSAIQDWKEAKSSTAT